MSRDRARSSFVHLHNHSNFSLLDGATRINDLMVRCRELGMHAVALTDHGNMFGAIQFYRQAIANDLKPIVGMEAYLAPGSRFDRSARRAGESAYHQVLLAKNATGYRNLMKLSSIGYQEGFYYRPRIDREVLANHAEGLIGTTSCLSGEVCRKLLNGDTSGARRAVGEMIEIFGRDNYCIELQDQGLDEQRRINPDLVRLAREFDISLVGTNDCHYLRRQDAGPHDVLLCIQTGKGISDPNRMKFPNDEFYVKSPDEMAKVFAEVPEALATTTEIADRCDLEIEFGAMHLPRFPVPEGRTLDGYFDEVVKNGFEQRMLGLGKGNGWRGSASYEEYRRRLEFEMSVIRQMGFSGYFLIVWDFICFARERGIPVGPGRGSAAGSLVAYALEITDIDPLVYGLVFERFLNPERISMPDIDIDFCMRRRGEVIEYVTNKYGRDRVAHIITFGTMAAKAAIRDVGRALEMSFGDVDRIAKMIPAELDVSIAGSRASEESLRNAIDEDPQVERLVGLAEQLEGQVRHASTHAAGVVIADEPLTNYVPLYKPPTGQGSDQDHFVATQYPMNDVDAIGLLKMDFLGLRTLTLVHDCLATISGELDRSFTTADIPLDDATTYGLFAQGATSGVFQFESSGMRDALRRLKPTRLDDLIAMNALYRPGPIRSGIVDEYIGRKHDASRVKYVRPELQPILEDTYGVIVYQEQVMRIASEMAGFSLGEADVLRKAMGKKSPEVMASMEEKFLHGSEASGIPANTAKPIWDMIVEFAGYGFNKSHSAAYAVLAYQTAYLKARFPIHFMAALLTTEQGNTDKVVQYINECRGMNIQVLPPDVNESSVHFAPAGEAIRFGLAAIKGVGEGAVEAIIEARERVGAYRHLLQFCEEVQLRGGINRKTIESLIKAGAMDSFVSDGQLDAGTARAMLMARLEGSLAAGQKLQRDRAAGQRSLFGGGSDRSEEDRYVPLPAPPEPWSERDVLNAERESLGYYVTGHPLQRHAADMEQHADTTTQQLGQGRTGREVTIAGLANSIRGLTTRKGERMAVVQVEDMEGQAEVVIFPAVYRRCASLLEPDAVLLFKGRAEANEDTPRLLASEVGLLRDASKRARHRSAQTLRIAVTVGDVAPHLASTLRDVLERHRGSIPVYVDVSCSDSDGFRARIAPNRYLFVDPTDALMGELEQLLGAGCARLTGCATR